jgi:hypothetical protein
MSRRAWRNSFIAAVTIWATIAAVIIFWHYIMLGLIAWVCLHFLRSRYGLRGRRSTFAQKVTAGSAAFAAWQSRWINPHKRRTFTARVPASAAPAPTVYDQEWDDVPY